MTRRKVLALALLSATFLGISWPANAQHVVGAVTRSMWQPISGALDQAAEQEKAIYAQEQLFYDLVRWGCVHCYHLYDNRDGRIPVESGNVSVVWLADSNGNIPTNPISNRNDIWVSVTLNSAAVVRAFSAQENISGVQTSGAQIQITVPVGTPGQNVIKWPDGGMDAALSQQALDLVNNSVSGGLHVNMAVTDLLPEDALFATKRALMTLNTTTYSGLGYKGPNSNIGAPVLTNQGTGSSETPIEFALAGHLDPFDRTYTVPAYTTIPIGAAPLIFVMNNGGSFSPSTANLVSGITPGKHVAGQNYPLANLFDGTTSCDTHNAAFGGNNDGLGTPITLFLQEPTSGAMNTAEFDLFRSFGNTTDSQEKGVINPTRSPYNPLHLGCGGGGLRSRAIGDDEVVGNSTSGLFGTPNSMGYMFFSSRMWQRYQGLRSTI